VAKRSRRKHEGLRPPKGVPQREHSRARVSYVAAVCAVAVAGIVSGAVLINRSASTAHADRVIAWNEVPGLQRGAPPWNSGSSLLSDRLSFAGLHALRMEGAVVHIHEHLELFVNGKKVGVPALVGIDPVGNFLTELHTHDTSGIIHVESPTQMSFTLGQFFCEWGVKLTPTCLGRYRGTLSWWVNGTKMRGDPAQLVLAPHQEIVIAAGRPPVEVPSSFAFPAGL
jgi:hypothetical protein